MQCSLWNKDISTIIMGMKSVEQVSSRMKTKTIDCTLWGMTRIFVAATSSSSMSFLSDKTSFYFLKDKNRGEV
nr:hypothetical protein [Tanacetum cinerariifolium]